MKLYHYIPKGSDISKKGILSVSQIPDELLKYGKRIGSNDPQKILDWLEKTFLGRTRSISVLTEPIYWQGNDSMLKEWQDKKDLIEIDFDALSKDDLIESIWCKSGSKADGTDEKIIQIQSNKIDFSPLPWHLCSAQKGLFFGVIRHYFLVMKEGSIPSRYLTRL